MGAAEERPTPAENEGTGTLVQPQRVVFVDAYFMSSSKTQIDGARLSRDIQKAIDGLSRDGFEMIAILPITSGLYGYSNEVNNAGVHYAWGYSITEGVSIVARLAA